MMKFLNIFFSRKPRADREEVKNFFDYPAREKKRIIKVAAQEANKQQRELIQESGYRVTGV